MVHKYNLLILAKEPIRSGETDATIYSRKHSLGSYTGISPIAAGNTLK